METKKTRNRTKEKAVFIAAAPNAEADDLALCRSLLFEPSTWGRPFDLSSSVFLQKEISRHFGVDRAYFFETGRAALYALLSACGIGQGAEVVLQAYTCLAVPLGIRWANALPVYADITQNSYNAGPEELKTAITGRTRAVIVQHTFGEIADIERISKMLTEINTQRPDDKKILLIEDCAHALGATYKGKPVGQWGDGAFFSFGQEKVLSTTQGGMALVQDKKFEKHLSEITKNAAQPSKISAFRALIHPLLWKDITRTYYFPAKTRLTLGRGLILLYRGLGLLKQHADPNTIDTEAPSVRRLSDAQGRMLINQWKKISRYLEHRKKIASMYNSLLPEKYRTTHIPHTYLRFPLRAEDPPALTAHLKKHKIIIGNWYSSPIHPAGTDLAKLGYTPGSCPNAEYAAKHSLNLPTGINISPENAEWIAKLVCQAA